MPRHILSLLTILTLFFLPLLQLEADQEKGSPIIREIRFHGLKRTTPETAMKIIRPVAPGQTYSRASDDLIIQKMRASDIFHPDIRVESRITGEEASIDVYAKDKWTLVPIPFAAFSKDRSWSGGLFGLESNLLGTNKLLGAGVYFGSFGWSGLGFYRDPYFMGERTALEAGVWGGVNDTEVLNPDEDVIREYEESSLELRLGLKHPVTRRFSLKGEFRYNHSEVHTGADDDVHDFQSLSFRTKAYWKELYYDIPFQYGYSATGEAQFSRGLNGVDPYQTLKLEAYRAFNPMCCHQFKIAVKAARGFNLPAQEQFTLGGGHGSFTLPGDQMAEEYAMAWASYGIPMLKIRQGTLAARLLYEAGFYRSDILSREFYHGPGLGIELYLNDIAVPAFMLTMGWNMETGRFQLAAGIGVGKE